MKTFDRNKFLREVISNFINKSTYDSLKMTYSGYITVLNNNNNNAENRQINEEKRKILEECLVIFSSKEFRDKIKTIREEQRPSSQSIITAVTTVLSEKVLGDKKRTYNMSNRYSKKIITPDSTSYTALNVSGKNPEEREKRLPSRTKKDMHGNTIKIQYLGILTYSTASVPNESINKYRITKISANDEISTYEVYSNIDLNKLDVDLDYCDAIMNELLSTNNIELSNAKGYIGQVENTTFYEKQLQVGQQLNDDYGFYRYQISKNYALFYDSQDLSAVIDFEIQQTKQEEPSRE